MLSPLEKERLVADILRNSFEAISLEDLGSQILPLLERISDTSASLLARYNEQGQMVPMSGTVRGTPGYIEEYYSQDPMQDAVRRINPRIFHSTHCPEWKEYVGCPAYEYSAGNGVEKYVVLRLSDTAHEAPGMVGVLLARTKQQPDFTEDDKLILARVLPALEALTHRSERIQDKLGAHSALETMLDRCLLPTAAFDLRGLLLWASEDAISLLGLQQGKRRSVPDLLVQAVRRLGAIVAQKRVAAFPIDSLFIPGENFPVRVDLRLARTRAGTPFVIAEFEAPKAPRPLAEAAERYRLTPTETEVLRLISKGLSDEAVSRRLFVSKTTVHTHVAHLLVKLGVSSRVQAALIACGIPPEIDPEKDE
jgi:DNA-binding CsgD family transcriptional regulator